uniref:Uncharacterized protein n=1 Tax=Rhizophora mucronata TaxID=61149 RepID=A0A2P2PLZ6_RHIMU
MYYIYDRRFQLWPAMTKRKITKTTIFIENCQAYLRLSQLNILVQPPCSFNRPSFGLSPLSGMTELCH